MNKHLTSPQPLLLLHNNSTSDVDAFPLPIDNKGTVVFQAGEKIDIACPGGSNFVIVNGVNTKSKLEQAQCESGLKFKVFGVSAQFNTITCVSVPTGSARYTKKKCAGTYREIEIGFNIDKRFIRHLSVCFDDKLRNSVYSHANLSSSIAGFQVGYPRPNFLEANYYNVTPDTVDGLYSRKNQRRTINRILGLSDTNSSIIQDNTDYYLSKGHYSAKADFVYGSQQTLTFYYVNTAPQWQTFNGGNWNTMEGDCRKFASKRNLDLIIYTGSYGISTLPNNQGVQKELYLWNRSNQQRGIPVPALFYRVVYDPKSKAGVAFIGLNNPYKKNVQEDIICRDVCDKINWVTWEKNSLYLGYSYCCEVDDLRKTITTIPKLDVRSLLI